MKIRAWDVVEFKPRRKGVIAGENSGVIKRGDYRLLKPFPWM